MTQNNNSWRKTYFTLLAGQAISFISSGILQMAIIFYLVAKTNSAIILTAATLIGFLPQACLGPFAGAFVDRHSRKSVMIGADLIIAAAGGILALVAFYMELPVWSIMVVLLIRSAGTAFHSPAFSAATPMIVPKEELTKCAGYTQTMQAVSAIISPAAAAFLYAVWPLNAIVQKGYRKVGHLHCPHRAFGLGGSVHRYASRCAASAGEWILQLFPACPRKRSRPVP